MESKKIPLIVMHTAPVSKPAQDVKSYGNIVQEYDRVLSGLETTTAPTDHNSRIASGRLQKAPPVPIPRQRFPWPPPHAIVEEHYIDRDGHEATRKRRIESVEVLNSRNVRRRPLWPAGPVDVLGITNNDPFHASPLGSDGHVHEMVHLYLNAHLILSLQSSAARPVRHRMVDIRKHTLFPTMMGSPAACSALCELHSFILCIICIY